MIVGAHVPSPPPHDCEWLTLGIENPAEASGAWRRLTDPHNGRPAYTHVADDTASLKYESPASDWGAANVCGADCWTIGFAGHHRFYLVTDLNISDHMAITFQVDTPTSHEQQKHTITFQNLKSINPSSLHLPF